MSLPATRTSGREERRQFRWFLYAGTSPRVVSSRSCPPWCPPPGSGGRSRNLFAGRPPVASAIAIFKYRLYDIDVVINKTVVFGALAAFITVVYVAIVVGLGAAIGAGANRTSACRSWRRRSSRLRSSPSASASSTSRTACLRRPSNALRGAADSVERVAGTYATEDLLPRIDRVIAEGTGAERAEVWLRIGEELVLSAAWPTDGIDRRVVALETGELPKLDGADRAVPVRYHEELLGAVAVTKPPGEALSPAEDKLLLDLSSQAGVVLSNVRLTADLEARLDQIARQAAELRASRQRIVAAQDAERRRLERNIHDGAQQHLVALAVKLRLARGLIRTDAARARAMLEELRGEIDLALDTLNALSLGIYPPLLEEQGIAAALAAQYLRTALPVHLDAEDLRRHPTRPRRPCTSAASRPCRTPRSTRTPPRSTIGLRDDDGALAFTVADDGIGFDPTSNGAGTGLQGMRDRIAVLGGDIAIASSPGSGTTIHGRIPVEERVPS